MATTGKVKTARGILKRAFALLNSGEVEWTTGTLGKTADGRNIEFNGPNGEPQAYNGVSGAELVKPKQVTEACLLGAVQLSAARFLDPSVANFKIVQEAFDLLAREVVQWNNAGEDLKQQYRKYVELTKDYNERYRYNEPILSFDEWQAEEFFYGDDPEDTIVNFNDGPADKKSALAVLRRAARISDAKA